LLHLMFDYHRFLLMLNIVFYKLFIGTVSQGGDHKYFSISLIVYDGVLPYLLFRVFYPNQIVLPPVLDIWCIVFGMEIKKRIWREKYVRF
jgi:hypothetical protein